MERPKLVTISSIPQLSDREFDRFQSLIYCETGIYLSLPKRALLIGRLAKRLRARNLTGFTEYYEIVERSDAERERLINCICTNETHFFREKRHYEFLESNAIPNWKALGAEGLLPRRIRVWSVSCSTGEEPFWWRCSCSIIFQSKTGKLRFWQPTFPAKRSRGPKTECGLSASRRSCPNATERATCLKALGHSRT